MSSVICLGDFGSGNEGQKKVADLMEYLIDKYGCKLILGLGNNLMPKGIKSVNDKQLIDKFEFPYKNLISNPKIKFYNILGENDYFSNSSVLSEIKYTKKNKHWILPHNFYCFKKIINNTPVEFIGIDSNLSRMKNRKTQEQWLINTILESKSRWNILFTHHPWENFGEKEKCNSELNDLFNKINATKKIDLIISGHENTQQHIYIANKPNMIISGVGRVSNNLPILNIYKELKYSSNNLGCCMIDFSRNCLKISFFNIKKKREYNFSIYKV